MKEKNQAIQKKSHSFSFKEAFLSDRDYIVICFLSFLIALSRKALSIPILAGWKLTVEQDTTLFSLFVLLEVITVCAVAFIPILLVLYIFFTWLLKKNIPKLQEVMRKQRKKPSHQKEAQRRANSYLIGFFILVFVIVTFWTSFFIIPIVALYYSVFKRVKMYFQLRKELKRVLKEHHTALEK